MCQPKVFRFLEDHLTKRMNTIFLYRFFYRILQTRVCVGVFSGFALMSSDPMKISIAFVVNFTGAWLEFCLSFFSNCTKQYKLQVFWYLQNMTEICRLQLIVLGVCCHVCVKC